MGRRTSQASFRLPPELKKQLEEIAKSERRTLSNTLEMLLRSAVRHYQKTGNLAAEQTRPPSREEQALAIRIAEIILEQQLLEEEKRPNLKKQTPGFRVGDRDETMRSGLLSIVDRLFSSSENLQTVAL